MSYQQVVEMLERRDPAQGDRGAAAAIAELRAGGLKRFRSLALRFEIPVALLFGIEADLGGEDVADYRDIIARALAA